MALDNAQFMSELSITDPPGTDPLSEGDDQIRTSKRTQLQSFPGVDKAVTTTADQLNDVALQSEANTFVATQIFTGSVEVQDLNFRFRSTFQTQSTGPIFIDESGINQRWSIFRENTNTSGDFLFQRFSVAGALQNTVLRMTEATGVMLASSGTIADPQYSFVSSPAMGMYRAGADALGFSAAGFEVMVLESAAIKARSSILARDASIGSPSYAFENEPGTGFFRSAGGTMTFVSTGTSKLVIKPNTINMLNLPLGSAGLSSGDLFRSESAFGFIEVVP